MRNLYWLILSALLITDVSGQISVAPPALFMNPNNRFGTFIIENKSGEPQEISIRFRFGYPASDSLGNLYMQYDDTTAETKFSLVEWIKGFPRKFVLAPGSQQIVRLTAQPPTNLADGTYWARIITSAQPQALRIDTVRAGIITQINIVFEQITTVLYNKGNLNTGIDILDPFIVEDSVNVKLIWKIEKKGNSPYFGTAEVKLFDVNGNLVDETIETLAIYFSMNKKAVFNKNKLRRGKFSAEIKFTTERDDIAPNNIIQLPPVIMKYSFTLK